MKQKIPTGLDSTPSRGRSSAAKPADPQITRSVFENILARYENARRSETFAGHLLRSEFARVVSALGAEVRSRHFEAVRLRWSVGQGKWATVPWIAALDLRETDRTSTGVYVIYLFRADMSGVYLTLNQGTGSWGSYSPEVMMRLRDRAAKFRAECGALTAHGFCVDAAIDLRSDAVRVRGYQESTIAHKFYERGAVPADAVLISDLTQILETYQKLVLSRSPRLSSRRS